MLQAILNKSWQQHPTRHQLYSHLPPITKTIRVRQTRHAGHIYKTNILNEFTKLVIGSQPCLQSHPHVVRFKFIREMDHCFTDCSAFIYSVYTFYLTHLHSCIIQGFQTIVLIFIVIFTMFQLRCPLAFFKCFLLNSGAYMELWTRSFI